MELTPEQLEAAQSMSLEELKALALKEIDAVETQEPNVTQARDENGRFSTDTDELDNSADAEGEDEPTTTIYRKEIENGDGSVNVYEAESLEELVDKIAEGKRNANKKIQEFIRERKATEAKTEQQIRDEEYMIAERLKKNPKQVVKEIAAEVIDERVASTQRSEAAQSHFVNTHPLYVANHSNGAKLVAWLQNHGHTEITTEGLEKAYRDLSASGLLVLRSEEADAATEVEGGETQPTVETRPETTQQRSPKKSSTIVTRNASRGATKRDQMPSEDEAYQMPLEDLRKLADAQLAKANSRE